MENPKNTYLLQEYDSAIKLTFHIDELRNKLTSVFLSLTTIFGGLLALLLENNVLNKEIDEYKSLSIIMIFISVVGLIMVCILAKLRKVQFEHFNIINNIRHYFLGEINDYKSITLLSHKTLPNENILSGSYLWTSIIMLGSSIIFAFGVYFLNDELTIGAIFFLFFGICNGAYYLLSRYTYVDPSSITYKDVKESTKTQGPSA